MADLLKPLRGAKVGGGHQKRKMCGIYALSSEQFGRTDKKAESSLHFSTLFLTFQLPWQIHAKPRSNCVQCIVLHLLLHLFCIFFCSCVLHFYAALCSAMCFARSAFCSALWSACVLHLFDPPRSTKKICDFLKISFFCG